MVPVWQLKYIPVCQGHGPFPKRWKDCSEPIENPISLEIYFNPTSSTQLSILSCFLVKNFPTGAEAIIYSVFVASAWLLIFIIKKFYSFLVKIGKNVGYFLTFNCSFIFNKPCSPRRECKEICTMRSLRSSRTCPIVMFRLRHLIWYIICLCSEKN